jgi:hypothetical protein
MAPRLYVTGAGYLVFDLGFALPGRRATIGSRMVAHRSWRVGVWFAVALGPGCAHAPWHPYRGWTAWRRDDVVLYTDTAIEHRSAVEWMAGISDIYHRTFFRDFKVEPLFAFYMQEDAPSPLVTADGGYRYGAHLRGVVPPEGGQPGLLLVGRFQWQWQYAHFVAHHFITRAVPGAPIWFEEGFARYLSFFWGSPENRSVICFGMQQPALLPSVTISVKDLFATTWRDYNDTSEPWISVTAWGLIDYLLHGEDGRWRPNFRRLMEALAGGKSSEEALAVAYPDLPLAGLDQRLRDHVRTARPPYQHCPLPAVLGPAGPPSSPPSQAAVSEQAVRAVFEAIERLPVRRGHADFFPPG